MFINESGAFVCDQEAVIERASRLTAAELAVLTDEATRVKRAFTDLELRLKEIGESERKGVLLLLYREIGEKIFDVRLAVETRIARTNAKSCATAGDKITVIKCFRQIMAEVSKLHEG